MLFAIGAVLVAFGAYFGAFAWANDGLAAGARLFGTTAVFGVASGVTGLVFRFSAAAHAEKRMHRWWIQVLPVVVGYVAFGIAAESSSYLDRMEVVDRRSAGAVSGREP